MAWFYGQDIIPICMYACMYVLMIGHAIILDNASLLEYVCIYLFTICIE